MSSFVVAVWSAPVGASLTGVTSTVQVAVLLSATPSLATKVITRAVVLGVWEALL